MTAGGAIILASASDSRRRLLKAAGVPFDIMAPSVDEAAIKREYDAKSGGFDGLALQLATRKALTIASRRPDALVIGADQVLVVEDMALDKPADLEIARRQLLYLRGKAHCLVTAVVCARDQSPLWTHVDTPELIMREFSEMFLDTYLKKKETAVTETVGGYRIEGYGIQLFRSITGDYFSILGLPLLPLLNFLRTQGHLSI